MITRLIDVIRTATLYAKNHPQILFVLVLLVALPFLFLYTGQQFLDVGRANQDRLQKDKVGLMHDTFASLLQATNFDQSIAQRELAKIAQLNPDIVDYIVAKQESGDIKPFVAMNETSLGVPIVDTDLFINASLRTDESIIFEFDEDGSRTWDTYRAIRTTSGEMYFLYTKISLADIDALFKNREQKAYFSLLFVYFFVIGLAYWHIQLTDYRYLFIQAKKSNEMKDLFTNMIAHELRAPLTAIRGYASLLHEKLLSPEEKQHAQRIKESAERLLVILNDLLDVARIQSGKLSVTNQKTDIAAVVKVVLDELRISAQEKNITLVSEGTSISHTAFADKKRLHQALTNLVSNAIKYTEVGVITVTVADIHTGIEIRVKDTGMGISSEDQKKLFAPFFRVTRADVSNITGTGLGMWITKELIGLMGAQISVESIKGVGTHVVIVFPKDIRIT